MRLLWLGNSPDLNAIEPCWWWMKNRSTAQGAPTSRIEIIKAWKKAWKDLSQEQIQDLSQEQIQDLHGEDTSDRLARRRKVS